MNIIRYTLSFFIVIGIGYAQPANNNTDDDSNTTSSLSLPIGPSTTSNSYDTDDTDPAVESSDAVLDTTEDIPDFYQSPDLPIGAIQAAPNVYIDVARNHWAAQAIAYLSQLGILTGYPDGSFQGEQGITRYEAAVLIARLQDFLIDYNDELYLYTNEDIQRLQNIIETQQTQIESQDEEIVQLNNQLETQSEAHTETVQTLIALQEQLEQAEARELDPEIVQETLERLTNASSSNNDYVRQLEQELEVIQQQISALNNIQGNSNPDQTNTDTDIPANDLSEDGIADSVNSEDNDNNSNNNDSDSVYSTAITPDGSNPNGLSIAPPRDKPLYIGISPLGINTQGGFNLGLRVGYDHLEGPIGLLGKFNYAFGAGLFSATVNGIIPLNTPVDDLKLYAGVGMGINSAGSIAGLMLELPIGAEYFIDENLSVFGEISPDYRFGVHAASVSISMGANLHF